MKKKLLFLLALLAVLLTGCGRQTQTKVIPISSLSPSSTLQSSQEPSSQEGDESAAQPTPYQRIDETGSTLATRINPPEGYTRVFAQDGSFTAFLRQYPLAESGAEVLLYNGETRQDAGAAAVLNITLSDKNHEGPAGAMARLLSEYHYTAARYSAISFTLGAQFDFGFERWSEGKLLSVDGNSVKWESGGETGTSAENFTAYLNTLFRYISVDTLKKDLTLIEDPDATPIQVGDIFIGEDANGKAVCAMVADLATNDVTGKQIMLLIEGGAPAQQAHVMENGGDEELSPWYDCSFELTLKTPDASYDIEQRYRPKALDG